MTSSSYFTKRVPFARTALLIASAALTAWPASGKTPGLSAIEVYPAAGGPGYVEINNFALNGKNEVSLCEPGQPISKSSYGKLQKIVLAPGMSLERRADGVLLLTRPGGGAECVVPANVKDLDRRDAETPGDLADRTELQGEVAASAGAPSTSVPQVPRGAKIFLVSDLDQQEAEFRLAEYAGAIPAWQAYLDKFPHGARSGQAHASLAILYVQAGEASFAKYQSSQKGAETVYEPLMAAKENLDKAQELAPKNAGTEYLSAEVHQEAQLLNLKAMREISAYHNALNKGITGYSHLQAAEAIMQHTTKLDPNGLETDLLRTEDTNARRALDEHFVNFDNDLGSNHPQEAYEAIKPLRAFAPECSDVQSRLDRLYTFYVEAGKRAGTNNQPKEQVEQFRSAFLIEARPEMIEMLKTAEKKAQESADEAAVRRALKMSSGYELDGNPVDAYEVLIDLTPAQRQQPDVAQRLGALQNTYLQKAPTVARDLTRDNRQVDGLDNEVALQRAYDLLAHCYALNNDPDTQDKVLILGGILSDYYMKQAELYLSGQDGLSANLGWAYLAKASHYQVADVLKLQNQIKDIADAHRAGFTPSIQIHFDDAGQPKNAGGFAAQLELATAMSIPSYSPRLKVFRANQGSVIRPTFVLLGDVQVAKKETVESIARVSTRAADSTPLSEAWTAANKEYESAHQAWESAEDAYAQAERRGRKKQIADAGELWQQAHDALEKAQQKRDAIPKVNPAEAQYSYTEQVKHLSVTVRVHFQIQDSAGTTMLTGATVAKTEELPIRTLIGVQPGDTSVQPSVGGIDETEFAEEVEVEAREALLQEVRRCVIGLPKAIFASADHLAKQQNSVGAAAWYMLYLDSTPPQPSDDWHKAQQFLVDNFNFHDYGETPQA